MDIVLFPCLSEDDGKQYQIFHIAIVHYNAVARIDNLKKQGIVRPALKSRNEIMIAVIEYLCGSLSLLTGKATTCSDIGHTIHKVENAKRAVHFLSDLERFKR